MLSTAATSYSSERSIIPSLNIRTGPEKVYGIVIKQILREQTCQMKWKKTMTSRDSQVSTLQKRRYMEKQYYKIDLQRTDTCRVHGKKMEMKISQTEVST